MVSSPSEDFCPLHPQSTNCIIFNRLGLWKLNKCQNSSNKAFVPPLQLFSLSKNFKKCFHAWPQNVSYRELLDLVGQKMQEYKSESGNKKSSSYEVIHFYKKLYFNPGLYEDGASPQNSYSVVKEVPGLSLDWCWSKMFSAKLEKIGTKRDSPLNFIHRNSVLWFFPISEQVAKLAILVSPNCSEKMRWPTWVETHFSECPDWAR